MFCDVSVTDTYQVLVVGALGQLTAVLLQDVCLVGRVLGLDFVHVGTEHSRCTLADITYHQGSAQRG